jgi:hypothetical protein
MQTRITANHLGKYPQTMPIAVPEYDFDNDMRWNGTILAGAYTSNSIQTFDSKGSPNDARSDNTD